VDAAQKVGLSVANLWSRFEGVQHTTNGRAVKTVFKAGTFKPQSEFKSLQELSIGATEGRIDPADLKHLRARLITKVQGKGLNLTEDQIRLEIDKLLNALQSWPANRHYNPVIREGFESSPLNTQVVVSVDSRPWETDWVLAKILVELSNSVIGNGYRMYFAEVIKKVREFLARRECSADQKQGVGIFTFVELPPGNAMKSHLIEGRFTPTEFKWAFTFFGTAQWHYSLKVTPIRAPDWYEQIRIENPLDDRDVTISAETKAWP